MRISLAYGSGSTVLEMPGRDRVRIAGHSYLSPLVDEREALDGALERPVASAPLDTLVPRSGSIAVLVSDLTRGAAAGRLLGFLLEVLAKLGAGPERVKIILALGMHRRYAPGEIEAQLGAGVVSRWKVLEHDASDRAALVEIGTTSSGTRCSFNRAAVDAALVIALGSVSFHYFAGYGGARKLILPGIAGEHTILANHRLSLGADAGSGLADGCRPGNLNGNPVHEDMLAGARLIGTRLFAVNVVTGGAGETLFVNAGDLDESHREACEFLMANFGIPVERPYRAVVLSAGGYPKDINLLQSHKALRSASYALEEGGVMIAAAECREGVGSQSYLDAFTDGRHGVPDRVRAKYEINSQAAISTYELAERFSIYLKTAMDDALVGRFGFCPLREGYADFLLEGIGDDEILIIANATQFLPVERAGGMSPPPGVH